MTKHFLQLTEDGRIAFADRLGIEAAKDLIRGTCAGQVDVPSYTLIALESTIVMTIATLTKLGGANITLDTVIERSKLRLAQYELWGVKPHGQA